jgi:diacylglycerol O-acyltransferase
VSFTADRDMMSDPDGYADALRASFGALKEAALKPSAPRKEANENKPAKKPAPRRAAKGGK